MSVAIATKGYFWPATGGGAPTSAPFSGGGVALPPPQPMVFITDIEEKELDYPFVHVYDIENGINGNGIVEVIELTNGENNND